MFYVLSYCSAYVLPFLSVLLLTLSKPTHESPSFEATEEIWDLWDMPVCVVCVYSLLSHLTCLGSRRLRNLFSAEIHPPVARYAFHHYNSARANVVQSPPAVRRRTTASSSQPKPSSTPLSSLPDTAPSNTTAEAATSLATGHTSPSASARCVPDCVVTYFGPD